MGMLSNDLYRALRAVLELPDHCTEVHIILKVDEPVIVETKYWAPNEARDPEGNLIQEFKRYRLIEIADIAVDDITDLADDTRKYAMKPNAQR